MRNRFTNRFFEEIVSKQTNTPTKIINLKIEGYYDEPGLHWSNPGVKKVTILTSSGKIELIIKILHERSKREILVYRFLSEYQNFPIPEVYYSEYDENTNTYILITEFGESIGTWPFKEPEIKLCGILLARIHSYFYGKVDILPDLFFRNSYYKLRYKFQGNTVSFLDTLKENDMNIIEGIYPNVHILKDAIETLDKSFFIIEPYTSWTLIHGSFHPPEIVSKKGEREKIPLGVDWEGSRVGHPAEDIIGISGQLADWGKPHFYPLLINSYLEEINNNNIEIDKLALEKEIIVENIISHIKNLPFLWNQYLKNKDDTNFSNWTNWFKESMPKTTDYFLNDILNKKL
ncbi:MAG: hypothetical protein ACXADU_08250 [Promethearchaeota archaeon]|jgi:hypothetical protein